jgi:uncharacterized protein (DUF2267 family)
MDDQAFLSSVESRADLDSREAAMAAAESTLRVLGERIAGGQAEDLAAVLPEDLGRALTAAEDESAEQFPPEEFVERVREYEREQRADLSVDRARLHVGAVIESLAETVDGDVWHDVRTQLPTEYERLYQAG